MLTLEDLGVLRDVEVDDERVVVTITPTYSGCPAMATMRDDLVHTAARPRASTTSRSGSACTRPGRATGSASAAAAPWPTTASPRPDRLPATTDRSCSTCGRPAAHSSCPRCGSRDVDLTSEFGPTACKAMYRCTACLEPFEHVKEI